MKITYVCDCCSKQYNTAEECDHCEKTHVFLDNENPNFTVACKFLPGDIFPTDITIVGGDGKALVTYHGNIRGNDSRTKVSEVK